MRVKKQQYVEEDRGYETPCWTWQMLTQHGYGYYMFVKPRRQRAHIVYYERKHGPVPAGLELDHLCRHKSCVNPDHLEPVTHAENVRRAFGERT